MEESHETTLEEAFITVMDASDAYIKQQAQLQALLKEVFDMHMLPYYTRTYCQN